jgi:predicted  nucleic acid-binding Zn-ribbon protein
MSLLNGLSCSVCGIEQTMNIVQQVQHGNILTPCANCGRLLVFKP